MFYDDAHKAVTRGYAPGETVPAATPKRGRTPQLPTVFVDSLVDAFATNEFRTFVCGPVPSVTELLTVADLGGMTLYSDGHFPTLRRPGKVIMFAASWFDDTMSPAECTYNWGRVDDLLRRTFRGVGLHSTPGTTGRALWTTTIAAAGCETLPIDVQRVIRANAGQGRLEHFEAPAGAAPTRIYELDQRWSYSALLGAMPVGRPTVLDAEAAEAWHAEHRYGQGLVDVSWSAPAGWGHVGILPQRTDDISTYPLHGRGVVSRVELDLAIGHGWDIEFHSALAWTETADVFRTWRSRLQRVALIDPHIARVVRSIILHTIGAMHGNVRRRTEYGAVPPTGATRVRLLDGGERFAWTVTTAAAWPETSHPEWSSLVWARGRRRLLDAPTAASAGGVRAGALHLERSEVVAFRTDAIYTTRDPLWHDDGQAGRYRLKRVHEVDGWPANMSALMAAKS